MRICHLTINKIELERRIHNQIETAKAMGYKVISVSLGKPGDKKYDKKNGFLKKRIFTRFHERGPLKFLVFNIKAFFSILFRPIQIIHAHDLWVMPAASIAALLKNCALVYDAHEFYSGLNIFRKRPMRKNVWKTLEWFAMPLVDTLITVSEPLGELYKKTYPQLKRVDIIRNVPFYENVQNVKKFEKGKYRHNIIFHGHFKPGRGLENLVRAMQHLPHVNLMLVGGGELNKSLHVLVEELNLKNIEFVEYIQQDNLIAHAAKADIGVVLFEATSLNYKFALPNKFFEYAMAGLPILTSNIETLQFYVEKYDIGKTVDPQDVKQIATTLENMLKDESRLTEWKENSLKMAKECNWENESKKLKHIYNEIFK